MNIFEQALRMKLRFSFKGLVSVEDLWDLKVENLDTIFKGLNARLKESETDSLLDVKTASDTALNLQVEIVKYIVSAKLAEQKARLEFSEKRERKAKLLGLIANKEDEELRGKSAEELRDMLDEV